MGSLIAREVGKNTYVTKKIKFNRNEKGEYKLDFISLFDLAERTLIGQFKSKYGDHGYQMRFGKRLDKVAHFSDPLLDFIQSRELLDHQKAHYKYNSRAATKGYVK